MVGAAACWPVAKQRETIAPARTMPGSHESNGLTFLHISRPTMERPLLASAAIFCNKRGPYHETGENRRIVKSCNDRADCSNGYRQRGRCDSRPDWHTVTVGDWHKCRRTIGPLISQAYMTDKPSLCASWELAHSAGVLCVYAHRRIIVRLYYSTLVLLFFYAWRSIKEFSLP